MGELVSFRLKADVSRPPLAVGASAEILFFTGVRIVRESVDMPQGDPQEPPPRMGVRKRRRRAS
jgi:hypothetical protein